jgi:hypothetical protein
MFTGDSSEKLRIAPDQVQIDTTHFRPQAPPKSALSRTRLAVNRTAVIERIKMLLAFARNRVADSGIERAQQGRLPPSVFGRPN